MQYFFIVYKDAYSRVHVGHAGQDDVEVVTEAITDSDSFNVYPMDAAGAEDFVNHAGQFGLRDKAESLVDYFR